MNRPYGFGGDLSQHTDKSKFEDVIKHLQHIPQRKMGHGKKRQPLTVFAFGKYWARPLRNGRSVFALSPLTPKKPFPKKVFAELFP